MKRRCPSAKTTSKASDDFPEPLGPVTTHSFPCGILQEISFKLCSRACSTHTASTAGEASAALALESAVAVGVLMRSSPRSAMPVFEWLLATTAGVP
jgi:hypothetical protein